MNKKSIDTLLTIAIILTIIISIFYWAFIVKSIFDFKKDFFDNKHYNFMTISKYISILTMIIFVGGLHRKIKKEIKEISYKIIIEIIFYAVLSYMAIEGALYLKDIFNLFK